MIFKAFKTFVQGSDADRFLSVDIAASFRDLLKGLSLLNFTDNFDGFIIDDLVLPTDVIVSIKNKLDVVPKYRVILKANGTLDYSILDGNWTRDSLEFKNTGTDVTVSILFVR